jgi:tetratricopeptide (TPR) repeat protein
MNGVRGTAGPAAAGKPGRNDPCPCGSGRKYKACCGAVSAAATGPAQTGSRKVDARAYQAALERAERARAAGRIGEAVAALRQAIAIDPQKAGSVFELGVLLLNSGRPHDALSCFDRVRALQPRFAHVHVPRGIALQQVARHAEALVAFQEAIRLAPANAEVHARIGALFKLQDKHAEAAASFRKAAKLAPNTSVGRLCGAYALEVEGKYDEALAVLRRVVAVEPDNAIAYTAMGKLLAETGKSDEAWNAFETALRLQPKAVTQYYDLVRIRRLAEADRPLLQRMLDVAQRLDLPDIDRIMLELAIGRAYDDLGDPEHAMQHYFRSSALKARLRPLDRDLIRKRVDWAMRTFTADYFVAHAGEGVADATPIVVVGMPRSGTTLVESILAQHGDVAAGQELLFWGHAGQQIFESGGAPVEETLRETAARYLEVLRRISDAPHVTDKKPENFFWAGLIHAAFPQARIIHCRRDPLDTCVSIISNFFTLRPVFSTEPGDLVFFYREYERLMAHWREVLPAERFMEVDYEALVTDPEPTIRRLVEFCGLDWQDACLRPEESTRTVNTASLWQVRRPISKGSVGRWRRYEPWLGELAALRR